MKFTEITIENFGRIKSATVKLSDRGLILVQGENLDGGAANSNGAGKSTLVEAISWVLYGKTAKGVSGDSVINRAAGKGCRVEITIDDAGEIYRIARYRKHKTGKNGLKTFKIDEGDAVDISKGTAALTQTLVDTIIGCPYEVFTAAVYAGQEAVPDLPNMTDKQLKLLIEEAAGITELEEAHELAKARARDEAETLAEVQSEIEMTDLGVGHARTRLEDTERSRDRWAAERETRIFDLDAKARTALRDAKHAKEALAEHKPLRDLEAEMERLNRSRMKIDLEADRELELRREVEAAQKKQTQIETEIATVKRRLVRDRDHLAEVEGRMGEPCEACGRNHDEGSLKSAIEWAKGKVRETGSKARTLIKRMEDAQGASKRAREALEKHRAGMTDPTRLEALSGDIRAKMAERRRQEERANDAKRTAQQAVEAVKAEKATENPYADEIGSRKKDLSDAVAKREAARARETEVLQRVRVAKGVIEVFSPKGVRARILDTVTPYLNARTAAYLGALGDGRFEAVWSTLSTTAKGELREKFSINARDLDDGGNFADLSGGEKRRVRLACALALQDLVATRASKPIDLWIGDEIDAALDVAGLERLMTVLESKARERGTIFVISHTDLRDWISETITVRRKDGVSEVVE